MRRRIIQGGGTGGPVRVPSGDRADAGTGVGVMSGGWEYSDFIKFRNNLEKIRDGNDEFLLRLSNRIAQLLLRYVVQRTPVKTGHLQRGWKVQKAVKDVKSFVAVVYNPVEYAAYVEFGHKQTPGRYVPVLGKRLKKSWVTGKFMLTKAALEVENKIPKLIYNELIKYYGGMFDGL